MGQKLGSVFTVITKEVMSIMKNMMVLYIEAKNNTDGDLHACKVVNVE